MPESKSKVILLITENPQEADLAKEACQTMDQHYEIIDVPDCDEALDYLHCRGRYVNRERELEPDIVLIVLDMPKMNGLQTIREIRTHSKTQALPIILMTSSEEEMEIANAYEYGANSYINKPNTIDEFIAVIKGLAIYWFDIVTPPPVYHCPE